MEDFLFDLELKKKIGARLKDARHVAHYTQTEVGAKLGMSQQQYSRFENGVFELNYNQIIYLCKLYDISTDYLFGLKEF